MQSIRELSVRFPCSVCRNRRFERQYGSFTRSFSLPETVDADGISADLKDGVLELRLPKKEAPTPKKIAVNKAS